MVKNRGASDNIAPPSAPDVMAAVFGHAPPIDTSFATAAGIEREATLARRLPGAENFVLPGNAESIALRREREEREEAHELAIAETFVSIERQRERDEWARSVHSFGSTSMTGAEWESFARDLRGDSELRRWLLERIRGVGHSESAAQGIADRVADVADIMSIPESQRTPEQRQRLEAARRDPTISGYLDQAAAQHHRQRGNSTERDRAARSGSIDASTSARADELSGFSAAPDIRAHYGRAQLRPTPVSGQPPTPAPEVAGAATPSGFEI